MHSFIAAVARAPAELWTESREKEKVMTQVLEVNEAPPSNTLEEPTPTINIAVNVDYAGEVTSDKPYVGVLAGETRDIVWTLTSELPNVTWDTPPVTMFSQGVNPAVEVEGPTARMRWSNDDPAKQGLSFHYRLHLLMKVNPTLIIPLSHDPLVHNDPPT
jgi:hypothetical protein